MNNYVALSRKESMSQYIEIIKKNPICPCEMIRGGINRTNNMRVVVNRGGDYHELLSYTYTMIWLEDTPQGYDYWDNIIQNN